jgi:hypothetical protein
MWVALSGETTFTPTGLRLFVTHGTNQANYFPEEYQLYRHPSFTAKNYGEHSVAQSRRLTAFKIVLNLRNI